MSNEMYGDSQAEQHLEKITACREIVKKIVELFFDAIT